MATSRLARIVQLTAAIGGLALAACGGGSSGSAAKAYEGRWSYSGMGTMMLDLRSDGTYSKIGYGGDFSGPVIWAEKGTYTFTPSTPGDDTEGTLESSMSHTYDTVADLWEPVMSTPLSEEIIVHAGPPRTLEMVMSVTWTYYGSQAPIPDTL